MTTNLKLIFLAFDRENLLDRFFEGDVRQEKEGHQPQDFGGSG